MRIRYRKRRAAKVYGFNPWNFKAEDGDLMVDHEGKLVRLERSSGWGKSRMGELYPRTVKPPKPGMIAIIESGEIYWTDGEL